MTRAHGAGSRRLSLAELTAAALLAVPAATATAATTPAHAAATPAAANRLTITMQAQQKTNWCWAASGNTIATWFGRAYSQNQFCNAAFNRPQVYRAYGDKLPGSAYARVGQVGGYGAGAGQAAAGRRAVDQQAGGQRDGGALPAAAAVAAAALAGAGAIGLRRRLRRD